jgi:betaine-homocysteine S-methyltransferase
MARHILESLKQGFVLGDGGYLEEASRRGYSTPGVIVEFPEVLRLIHQDFFRAGSQVLQALTWRTTRKQLTGRGGGRGWGDRVEEINRTAVRLAKKVAAGEALVAGCLSATGYGDDALDLNDAKACAAAQAEWDEQIAVMVDEGVNLLICESFLRLKEARLALARCKKTKIPTMVCLSVSPAEAKTQDGASMAECARVLVKEGADIVGSNCCREPAQMWPHVLEMRRAVDAPIAFQPSGYRTSIPGPGGYQPIREAAIVPCVEMAKFALQARAEGINYIGACCGAGPELIRAMAQALGCERDAV